MQLASVDINRSMPKAITNRPVVNPNSVSSIPICHFESKSQIMQSHRKATIVAQASDKVRFTLSEG